MNESRGDSFLSKIKSNIYTNSILSFVALVVLLATFTDSIDKLSAFTEKHFLETVDDKLMINDLNEIRFLINETQDGSFEKVYKKLSNYLTAREESVQVVVGAMEQGEKLYIKKIDGVVVISTNNQYKREAFVLFFNAKTGDVLLADDELGLGITGVKVIEKTGASPSSLLIVKYITITGTGTFGNSVKFYAIDGDLVLLSLDKPYSEVNSGWGAFEADTVEFKTKNDVLVKNGVMEIHTTGVAIIGDDSFQYQKLPEEVYVWNPLSHQFDQVKGRITDKESLMTHIYSDIAGARGDWFIKPRRIDRNELDEVFSEEGW